MFGLKGYLVCGGYHYGGNENAYISSKTLWRQYVPIYFATYCHVPTLSAKLLNPLFKSIFTGFYGSDHCPVSLELSKTEEVPEPKASI